MAVLMISTSDCESLPTAFWYDALLLSPFCSVVSLEACWLNALQAVSATEAITLAIRPRTKFFTMALLFERPMEQLVRSRSGRWLLDDVNHTPVLVSEPAA